MGRMKKLLAVLLIATMAFVMTAVQQKKEGETIKVEIKSNWRFPYDFAV